MGFIVGLFAKLIKIFLYFLIFFALVVLIPNLPPYTKFTRIDLEPTLANEGPLALNDALNNAQKLHENKLLGPEAFQIYDGELYTSLATGEIVKVSPGGHVTFVTKIGSPCKGLIEEHVCGRPLGFQIDEKNKLLYVADSYHGIWKVDLKTDKKQLLVSPNVEVQGCQPKMFNDLVLDKEGNLYYTVSSCDFQLKDGCYIAFADPSGRLLQYDAGKNKSKVLLDNLWLANGITLSPENDYLLVSETFNYKITKYYIRGPKKGQKGTFIAGLPGLPDNIRALPDDSGVLVALYSSFDEKNPLITRSLASVPIVRKFLARLLRLIEIPFEFLNDQYPHIMFEEIVYYIGSFRSMSGLAPPRSGLIYIDWNGKVIASYYNTDSSLKHISDAIVFNDVLHVGNPHKQNFIGGARVPTSLKKAFISKKHIVKEEVKKATIGPQKIEIVKEKEVKTENIESETKSINYPPKPTATIPKPTTSKPDDDINTPPKPDEKKHTTPKLGEKIHETPKPEEKKYTTAKPDEKIHATPKPEEKKYTTAKPEKIKYTTPKPEEKKKETTANENRAQPKIQEKQLNNPSAAPPKLSETKSTVATKPAVKQTESKIDNTKQTDTKSTKPTKSEMKQTVSEMKQADEKPKTLKQTESNLKQSKPEEPVQKKDKTAPLPPHKQTEQKSTRQKQTESKTTTPKPVETKSGPPKQADVKPSESVDKRTSQTKSDSESKPVKKENIKPEDTKPTPEQIPVKEDIPSDTAKPYKETIKVIKKEGPTEIPNLNL